MLPSCFLFVFHMLYAGPLVKESCFNIICLSRTFRSKRFLFSHICFLFCLLSPMPAMPWLPHSQLSPTGSLALASRPFLSTRFSYFIVPHYVFIISDITLIIRHHNASHLSVNLIITRRTSSKLIRPHHSASYFPHPIRPDPTLPYFALPHPPFHTYCIALFLLCTL